MQIAIATLDCNFPLEIGRVISVFFDDANVHWSELSSVDPGDGSPRGMTSDPADAEDVDLWIRLRLRRTEHALVADGEIGRSKDLSSAHEASHQRAVAANADDVTLRKEGKHTVLNVLNQLLSKWTGVLQPWGYLTGIRPMKLVHRMKQEQRSDAVIDRILQHEHGVQPDRSRLLLDIAHKQLQVVPDLYQLHREVSLYIGIPFCPTHCAYCTFPAYSMVDKHTYVDAFQAAMAFELAHAGALLREYGIGVTSVYVGGGTPTSLRAFELDRLLTDIETHIPHRSGWREYTVEAGRPDTITPDRVRVMLDHGVNRISVNPQTFEAETLRHIRRGHTPDQVDHRFRHVREAGFNNINMDMIIGLPGETLEDVQHTLSRIARLEPDAVTVHTMSLKRSAAVKNETDVFVIADDAVVREMMDVTKRWAADLGYEPYYVYRQMDILGNQENIGYSYAGKESIYNICIMEEQQTIVGIGGGAVTKAIGVNGKSFGRLANPREPKAYIDTVQTVMEKKDRLLRRVFASFSPQPVPLQSSD